jgi:hypothetical protein
VSNSKDKEVFPWLIIDFGCHLLNSNPQF